MPTSESYEDEKAHFMLPPPASPPPLPPPDADLERGSIYAASSICETGSSTIAQDQPDSLPESF